MVKLHIHSTALAHDMESIAKLRPLTLDSFCKIQLLHQVNLDAP